MNCYLPFAAAVVFGIFALCSADGHMGLECSDGWTRVWNKCLKIFYGDHKRAYTRAREICGSYGSRLVTIRDQVENDLIGEKVKEYAGEGETYYIGLSKEKTDACSTCTELRWSNGETATDYHGFWSDDQPDDTDGLCVYSMKNSEDYTYDRPYTWAYSNCMVKRSFVCERMAVPEGSFHCLNGEYINMNGKCDGASDCEDGSDEFNCSNTCHYYHTGVNGVLGQLLYRDGITCTWSIETPVGTNAYVQLNNFNTEYEADTLTIYAGSFDEAKAMRLDHISGNQGTKIYRSDNNFIHLKFMADSSVSNTGLLTGFTGTFGSLQVNTGHQIDLVAVDTERTYTLNTFDVDNTQTFLGKEDYVMVIRTTDTYQFGQMITLILDDVQINDDDMIMFYDGDTPYHTLLSTYCNDDQTCDNYKLVYSTGKTLSILLRTGKTITNDVSFRFRYKQGCYYETTDPWGTIFTPGYTGGINYPNYVKCTWKITVNEPIAIYFSSQSRIESEANSRTNNGDYLKLYDDGTMVPGSSPNGLMSADIAGKTFESSTGNIMLEFDTSVIRSAKGFYATWSTACPNPNYDNNTIVTPSPVKWHYRAAMTLTCKSGYVFQQEQIPSATPSVMLECGFKGMWKDYLQIPRCTPIYCGVVPNINNGYIESSTGSVFGSTATYKCNIGSAVVSGSLEITCQSNGLWSTLPTCSATTCPAGRISENIQNGQGVRKVGDGTSIGTIYEYECDAGYEFASEPYVYCKEDGSWSQNFAPTCRRLTCRLPSLVNARYTGNTAGSFINFEISALVVCNTGYEFSDDSPRSVTCLADRTVSPLPECIDIDECENPSICETNCDNNVGSYKCSCNAGFYLANDGRNCLDFNECGVNNGNCDGACNNNQGSYECSCNLPYVLYTTNMTSGYAIPASAGERGDLSTDTFHIGHSCVLNNCPAPQATLSNGKLLTKRVNHRYGDSVEYLCDIGYTPRRTTLTCGRDGTWDRVVPTCSAALCSDENVGFVQTLPTYSNGPYSYGEQLTMQCEVAGRNFNKFRFCTYNKDTDTFEMQGSPYECGVVDCGDPKQEPGSNYLIPANTLFGSSFEFTCGSNTRLGQTNAGSPSTVFCLADGYWDFGNLQCTGQKCLDPGYPAGGDIITTGFVDKSTVKFECNKDGYTLSTDITLTCQGRDFIPSNSIPTCIDTQKPVITNCPTSAIVVRKYELLQTRLPRLTATDNTGIRSLTYNPRNANTTLYVSSNIQVTFTATDHAGNSETCVIQVVLADEEPPVVTCPTNLVLELNEDTDTATFTKPTIDEVIPFNQRASIKTFQVTGGPTTVAITDLYKTFTFTITVTDQSDNSASCQGEVFVRPTTCGEVSFPTPLNAQKVCTDTFNGIRCVLTCTDFYTFEDGKTKTVMCSNGNWDTAWIPACIRDQSAPLLRCPQSQTINELSSRDDTHLVDFTLLRNSVTIDDLNTFGDPVFSPESYTFTPNDLYIPKVVTVSVTDSASNTGTCSFQYTAVPPVCSELSLPVPRDGTVSGTQRGNGWDVTITCNTGKILRNVGATTTVSCNDNIPWADEDIFPICIDDVQPPVLVCPSSRQEKISTEQESREITFATDASYSKSITDYSGIKSTEFIPASLTVSQSNLNQAVTVQMRVTDNANNVAQCSFQVLVAAEECSPLMSPKPANGVRTCQQTSNGWSCTLTCNTGYSFYGTTNSQVVTTCINNGPFTEYIPDCARDSDVTNRQYIAKLRYQYVPDNNAIISVPSSCTTYYQNAISQRSSVNQLDSKLDLMTSRFNTICSNVYGPFNTDFSISFLPADTEVTYPQQGRVEMIFSYTISYSDISIYSKCTSTFGQNIEETGNTFSLSANIPGDGASCPELKWDNFAQVNNEGLFCAAPYFESLTNSGECVLCPAGTSSNGVQCTVCPIGTYRLSAGSSCVSCPSGYTTAFPGSSLSSSCIAPCLGGQVSPTGYAPCYSCPVGSYRSSATQCTSCGIGQTTASVGSDGPEDCVASSAINEEPCTIGTQDVSNGNNVCEPCPVGTYRSASLASCSPCPDTKTSTYVLGGITRTQCLAKCSPGFTSTTGLAPCTPCPKGSYGVNETTCLTCPVDYTTVTDGMTVCIENSAFRLNCPRGTSRNPNTGLCVKCPKGRYNSQEEGVCSECNSISSTFFEGATAETMCRLKCSPGYFSNDGLAPCTPCGIGKYSTVYGATTCESCSLNNDMITATATSTSSSQCIPQCDAGFFSYDGYNHNSNACRQCPRNYYQNLEGQTGCIQCDPNTRYSDNGGLTAASQCLLASGKCTNTVCSNGGNCVIRDNDAYCECTQGQYYGQTCGISLDHCASDPCYNGGLCSSTPAGFTCDCRNLATGPRCENIIPTCDTSQGTPTCKNGGHCINRPGFTECICPEGFSGQRDCSEKTDICQTAPCDPVGSQECRDDSLGSDLRRKCICRPGYTGVDCQDDIDECESNPCINGATCRNLQNAFRCDCRSGYSGTYCQVRTSSCSGVVCNSLDTTASCVDEYSKDQSICICNTGYSYDRNGYTQYQIELNRAPDNLGDLTPEGANTVADCRERCTSLGSNCDRFAYDTNNNRCYVWNSFAQLNLIQYSNVNFYTKSVIFPDDDFYTLRYNLKTPTIASRSDQELLATLNNYGLNICSGTTPLFTRCCQVGQTCLDNDDLPNGICSSVGLNYPNTLTDYDVQFKCSASRVFGPNVCSRKTDYCSDQPCMNGGQCLSIFGTYRCTCNTGYTGKNCQTDIDDCANNPCINGGTCEDRVGGYECTCPDTYEGINCQNPKRLCDGVTCNGHGICSNIVGVGYRCDCSLGYEGQDCENEINYCLSNPCQHGGGCQGRIGGYSCNCVTGWEGTNCESPVKQCNQVSTGGQCLGTCYNIFNGYSCQCGANTYGLNCENIPNPCRDYSKCQNNAVCSYNQEMSCQCPTKYKGDGCEILIDYCGLTNPCENGADCSVTNTGYECTCKPGYTGERCEMEVNDCVPCPGGAQCYDAHNTYYCRCPIQKTGNNCLKDVDVDYDLYFNHPQGYGYAWIPYYTDVKNANYLSVSLWVRYSMDGDTGVYMTQFMGKTLENADKFLEFEEKGLKIHVPLNTANFLQLQYGREARVNDGHWHLVTVVIDMVNGKANLYLDTVFHDEAQHSDLIMPAANFSTWIVLGCEFDNDAHMCNEGGNGFHGYLSQINWYRRELAFQGTPESDIALIFRSPKHVFDENNKMDLILVWYEYLHEKGVSRMSPSEAHGEPCSNLARNPPCHSYRATTTMVSVTGCPDDQTVFTDDRITTVTWTEPTFLNLGSSGVVMKPDRLPGSTFSQGVYRNTYIGIDSNNNRAVCHFTVYVNAGKCENPPDPYRGTQTCNTVSDRKGCMISCINQNPNIYMIDRRHPDLFTCGRSGWWNQDKPFQKFRYPSCGLVKARPKVNVYAQVPYTIGTAACIAASRNLKVRTYEELTNLDQNNIFIGDFCDQPDCSDAIVEVTCQALAGKRRRRKRQTFSLSQLLLEITLKSIDARTTLDGEDISAEDFLTYFILGQKMLVFDTIPNLNFQEENFMIQVTEICPAGEVLRDGQCVECGPGNYFRYTDSTNTTSICDDCPIGSYQDEAAARDCKSCGATLTTEMTGTFEGSMCKKSCPIGQYFDSTINDCRLCPIGYYQDKTGQFRCEGCLAGQTTKDEGSTSSQQCSVSCDSGYELNDNGACVACPVGQYRDASLTRTCSPCNTGFITENVASKTQADCSIIACNPGNYRDVIPNVCKPCPLNTYQPTEWQTSCISCGDSARWRTETTGSTLQTQCKYYCPSGYEVAGDPNNYSCTICPIGTYKNNAENIQGFCTQCAGNRRTETTGATSSADCTIYKCPIGNKPNSANTGCEVCPLGYYQDVAESKDCKKCEDDYSTRQEESTSSAQCERYCPSGQEKIDGICRPCRIGYYKNNLDGLFEMCKPCNPLYTTDGTGSDNVNDCSIRTCPPGTKRNIGDTGCELCPIGTYQPQAYQRDCIQCPAETSTRGVNSTASTDCESYCNSGFEKENGLCAGCEIGYYKNNDLDGYFSPCNLCPIGFITENKESVSNTLCTVGNCSAGSYLKPDKSCEFCAKGTYQPEKWQTSCLPCGTDKTTETEGSDKMSDCILECSPGFEDIGGVCRECPRGTYKIEFAAARCKPCPVGTTSDITGATSPDSCTLPACTAGQYLDRVTDPLRPECKPCGYDTYQDEIWQEQCEPCQDNKVTLAMASDESSDCVLDCASGTEYDGVTQSCDFCSIGYYRNQADRQQPDCQRCPIDKITNNQGATDLSECTIANCTQAGYYRETTTNTCEPCPIGKYNSVKWRTSCTDCPLGNSTKLTGSTTIDDCRSLCPLGQYVGPDNRCQLCPIGTYRSDIAADTCTTCPTGRRTPGTGAVSVDECSLSPCVAGQRYIESATEQRCVDCGVGSYQPNAGSLQCTPCPFAIQYTPSTGSTSVEQCRSPCVAGEQFNVATSRCVPCPPGTYQPEAFEFTCTQCPAGRKFTENTGTRKIEDCLSYCSASAANDCSTNATCTVTDTNNAGYTCNCFTNYESVGQVTGRECLHKCDLGYCKNGATCTREPRPSCTCSEWYKGTYCETRKNAEELSDETLDIVIPVSIGVGGLLLFLIILAVCCLCWRSRGQAVKNPQPQYSEFNGDRVEKGSVYSYGIPYSNRPPSGLMMLAPAKELVYDNRAYSGDQPAVYEA